MFTCLLKMVSRKLVAFQLRTFRFFDCYKPGKFSSVCCQTEKGKNRNIFIRKHTFVGNSISQFQLVSVFGHQRS